MIRNEAVGWFSRQGGIRIGGALFRFRFRFRFRFLEIADCRKAFKFAGAA
jgi:hypothetical protein